MKLSLNSSVVSCRKLPPASFPSPAMSTARVPNGCPAAESTKLIDAGCSIATGTRTYRPDDVPFNGRTIVDSDGYDLIARPTEELERRVTLPVIG